MTRRKRVSLTIQVDVDSDEDRQQALHRVVEMVRSGLADREDVVRCNIHGTADFAPTDEELAAILGDREE